MSDSGNPFARELTERLAIRLPGQLTWADLLIRLEAQKHIGAIVGGRGSGKTTLLTQLQPHLEAKGFRPKLFRLSTESSLKEKERLAGALREVTAPEYILIDGAEQLSTRLWLPVRAAASRAAGLVVTVHRVSRLPMLLELETNPTLLRELVRELADEDLAHEDANNLLLRHRGSIRESFTELHQWWDERAGEAS